MKRLLMLLFASAALCTVTHTEPRFDPPGRHDGFRGNFGVFYSSLAPQGEWIDFNFGYAWRPSHVGHGWRPYLYGRWVWSDYGWYWVSDEPYGWATYHYGRWYYDDYYGWIWTPGDTWGPAWVEWRYDDDYIGWAPLSPSANFDVSVGVTFGNNWVTPYNYWNFVPGRYFAGTRVVDYVQPMDRTRRIFGNTRSVVDIRFDKDRVINRGIDVNFVERKGNGHVERADVITRDRGDGEHVIRDGDRQRVEVFRPRLDAQVRGGEMQRPPDARRAEHQVSFDTPRDRRDESRPAGPDRSIERGRDTRIQERGRIDRGAMERAPVPERRMESPRPPDRSVSREREMRPADRRQQAPPRFQERRAPQARPAPMQRGNPKREEVREKQHERRDEPPRGHR